MAQNQVRLQTHGLDTTPTASPGPHSCPATWSSKVRPRDPENSSLLNGLTEAQRNRVTWSRLRQHGGRTNLGLPSKSQAWASVRGASQPPSPIPPPSSELTALLPTAIV